jgi:AAA family ATP:ADP antiporter
MRIHDGDGALRGAGPGEAGGGARRPRAAAFAFAIALAAAFQLGAYEFIRGPATSLAIEAFGARNLPYAMLAGAVLTFVLLFGYGLALTRLGPRRTLLATSLASSAAVAACFLASRSGSRAAAGAVYAFREAYIVILIEQYWSLINSVLRAREAKTLNGLICGIGSLGAIAGGYAVARVGRIVGPGIMDLLGAPSATSVLLLFAALLILPAAACSDLAFRLGGEPRPVPGGAPAPRAAALSLSLFRESSYLRRIGLLVVLTQFVAAVLDLRFFALVQEALPVLDERTAYIGGFFARLNVAAGVLQFIGAPLLLGLVRLRFLHPAIPLIHVATGIVLLARPTLFTGSLAYLVFKAVDYSVFRAGKEMLYMPLSFDSRYRAKEVIDAFGYRASKGIAAAATSAATFAARSLGGALPGWVFPGVAVAASAAWLATVLPVVRRYEDLADPRGTPHGATSRSETSER